jgi:hypothetical protein
MQASCSASSRCRSSNASAAARPSWSRSRHRHDNRSFAWGRGGRFREDLFYRLKFPDRTASAPRTGARRRRQRRTSLRARREARRKRSSPASSKPSSPILGRATSGTGERGRTRGHPADGPVVEPVDFTADVMVERLARNRTPPRPGGRHQSRASRDGAFQMALERLPVQDKAASLLGSASGPAQKLIEY